MDQLEREKIESFWSWFIRHEVEIARHKGADDTILDELLEQLHLVHSAFFFEVGVNMVPHELIVTAEGKQKLFSLVDELVANSPQIPSWKIIALKPAQGFDFVTNLKGIDYDPKTLWFLPLSKKDETSSYLGLRIGLPNFSESRASDAKWAILIILDTGLGERSAAQDIHYVEVVTLPHNPAAEGYIELTELARYIPFWKRKQV